MDEKTAPKVPAEEDSAGLPSTPDSASTGSSSASHSTEHQPTANLTTERSSALSVPAGDVSVGGLSFASFATGAPTAMAGIGRAERTWMILLFFGIGILLLMVFMFSSFIRSMSAMDGSYRVPVDAVTGVRSSSPIQADQGPSMSSIAWHGNLADALREAKKTNRPLMVACHAEVPGVQWMEKNVYHLPEVVSASASFICVQLDGNQMQIYQTYNVQLFPTLLFLDASGRELDRLTGPAAPDLVLSSMLGAADKAS